MTCPFVNPEGYSTLSGLEIETLWPSTSSTCFLLVPAIWDHAFIAFAHDLHSSSSFLLGDASRLRKMLPRPLDGLAISILHWRLSLVSAYSRLLSSGPLHSYIGPVTVNGSFEGSLQFPMLLVATAAWEPQRDVVFVS